MSARELRLHALLNRVVVDADGRRVGRIEELRAEVDPDDPGSHVITEFHLGTYAFFEALAGDAFGRALARFLGRHAYRRYVVPWDLMDLGDSAHPRLLIRRDELPADRGD